MTEKEKRDNGLLYDFTEEMVKELAYAKEQCYEYNHLRPSDKEKRRYIMRNLLGAVGERFTIEPTFYCDFGYNISIGQNFYSNHNLVLLDGAKIEFGDNVFIAPNCGFYTAGHPIKPEERNKGFEYAKPIKVGNNVWIGGNVVVLPGVTIGDNVTIGAGSVVTKDIPADVIAYGNPCKVIKSID